jgi:NADH-quinone oxidoreductase subunit N
MGCVLTLLGVCFKLSVVPMHLWVPDVYQGAPTPVTAFISVVSKTAGFVFALRLFSLSFVPAKSVLFLMIVVIAAITMTVGNLTAIPQKNMKRLLAYSTISQAGYILVGFAGSSVTGMSSVLFYLLVYTFTNIAAFTVVIAFSRITGSDEIADYAGLARRSPLLALAFLLALLSLAGIPPLAGFVGKFFIFYSAMAQDYLWLVIVAALNSIVSLFYYLLILKQMYIVDRTREFAKIVLPLSVKVVLVITIAGILGLGIFPTQFMNVIDSIARSVIPGGSG